MDLDELQYMFTYKGNTVYLGNDEDLISIPVIINGEKVAGLYQRYDKDYNIRWYCSKTVESDVDFKEPKKAIINYIKNNEIPDFRLYGKGN